MTYILPSSGSIKNKNDTGEYILPVTCIPKGDVYYLLVTELALLMKSSTARNEISIKASDYWKIVNRYDIYKDDYIKTKSKFSRVSLVPTGYCEGGCSYCYAKDGWSIENYITPEIFDKACEANGITELKDVIIYGGEPLSNWDAYLKILQHILFNRNCPEVYTCTSFFYDDETFEKLKQLCSTYGNRIGWSISIDPQKDNGKYLRRYKGDQTYEFVLNRLCELLNYTDNIGIRLTLSHLSPNPFDLLSEIERRTGKFLSATFEPVKYHNKMALTEQQFAKLKWDILNHMQEEFYSGKRAGVRNLFNPVRKIFEKKTIFGAMKNCDMGFERLTILPDGGISDCSEDVQLNLPKKLDKSCLTDTVTGFKEICQKCDYKYMCNLTCFEYVNSNSSGVLQYCDFHAFCVVEGIKAFITFMPESECDKLVSGSLSLAGII